MTVRRDACIALGKIGEKAATNEVISQLVKALRDEKEIVRRDACIALGKIGETAATNEVISQLVKALRDEKETVRRDACIALGKIGETAATNEVIGQLVEALRDEEETVRNGACEALEIIGGKTAPNEVISHLLNAAQGKRENVRNGIYYAVGKIAKKAATSEVIRQLVQTLGDEREYLRKGACAALGDIGEKAATNEVISQLLILTKKDNSGDRFAAVNAIRKILNSARSITRLDHSVMLYFCLSEQASKYLEKVPEEELLNLLPTDENSDWVSAVTRLTLLKGAALVVDQNKFMVYGRTEPFQLPVVNLQLREQLIKNLENQGDQLYLYCKALKSIQK